MTDALAAVVDVRLRPPRQGDTDDGHGLLLDGPDYDRWDSLLATGAVLFGPASWWPAGHGGDARTALWTRLASRSLPDAVRPRHRPSLFPDAGMALLRDTEARPDELWCRADHGRHGYLSIAAHAHADALSVEVRHDGSEVLVDPGTYCYHGEPEWRHYLRSTLAHNTIEIDAQDQSVSGGPFLWSRHADTQVSRAVLDDDGVQTWTASHTGYHRLDPALCHERRVTLDPAASTLTVVDNVTGATRRSLRLAFHVGPDVVVDLSDGTAALRWTGQSGQRSAQMHLPDALQWSLHRGETEPPLGWYSPTFGRRVETSSLIGSGAVEGVLALTTRLELPTESRHG